ncbi:MAG: hypothetical protein DHS20C08_08060 [Rhodomicrobium sp.]|nr:MAG: hypothetical protein DHS20C08_08060 [Rhodomicrobium sp.]
MSPEIRGSKETKKLEDGHINKGAITSQAPTKPNSHIPISGYRAAQNQEQPQAGPIALFQQ